MVALIVLGGALLGLSLFVSDMAHAGTHSQILGTATELAVDRIETVKSSRPYSALDGKFVGTESPVDGYTGYTRQTIIRHVGGGTADSLDYRIVTVIVTNPAMTDTVRETTIIAKF